MGPKKHRHFTNDSDKQILFNKELKKCTKCEVIKSIQYFANLKLTSDGKSSWCNECCKNKMMSKRKTFEHKYQMLLNVEPSTDIDLETFKLIIASPCYYCGDSNTTLGLDRLIPGKDDGKYIKKNVVSCCKTCNYMKRALGLIDFYNHIEKIYNNKKPL